MRVFEWPRQRRQVERFFESERETPPEVVRAVDRIIAEVKRDGSAAVARLTRRFDGVKLRADEFEVGAAELKRAWSATSPRLQAALRLAARRIKAFHERQRLSGWSMHDPELGEMEMRVAPIERVGVYIPGGAAPLFSTVLMSVIPARVAGVDDVTLVTPPGPSGLPYAGTLAAAHLVGVDRVFRVGGAQAIAALALGAAPIPRVDKIVGPGNIYVATAKQRLFGRVDIDTIAGPTEILILADDTAPIEWIAADMLAQAEHDRVASAGAVLIGGARERAAALKAELNRQLKKLPRAETAAASIRDRGFIILAPSAGAAVEIADLKAPEHLEIMTRGARSLSKRIRHAGAIFIGPHSPEPLGDYLAGPNHTLPTGGTARFFSPLSVWSFYKTSHAIEATRDGLARHADAIETLAEAEQLTAHARSVRVRRRRG
jgi:histidinol dehydrogenase